ncbi:MAG: hypothetical protein QOD99_304, partial [Chthoniobacter sp.]|nr:hypothetical protein [Chthoniobacter sp.]
LHRTYISDVERGVRNVSIESIARLARALELSVSTLFDRANHGAPEAGKFERLVDILLVEDNPNDVALTRRAFKKAKITNPMHVVHDGAEALDFIFARGQYTSRREGRLPGIILLDLNLPEIGGLEVLRQIKADPHTRNIPVVVLTVSDRDRDIAASRRLGAECYLIKPVGFRNLSDVTPDLHLEWALVRPSNGGGGTIEEHGARTR